MLVLPFLHLILRRVGFHGTAGSRIWPLGELRWDFLTTDSCEAAHLGLGRARLGASSALPPPPPAAEPRSSLLGPSCGCLPGKGSPPGWQAESLPLGKSFAGLLSWHVFLRLLM